MPITLTRLADLATHRFDSIIDVRAPAEYAEDHLPDAISLPVLDDAERAQVGTIYKQVSPFTARKAGAALVAQNAARHLQGPLADKPGGWRPLVYCWRGGQRSGSFASILAQVGWRVETLAGGYKAWRKLVLDTLDTLPPRLNLILLDGNTGSAKTALLAQLAAQGVQVLDLEAMANHRGSLFGAMGAQPAPKAFQTRLAVALAALDPARPVVLEAESAKVGNLTLPHALWQAMSRAPRIALDVPLPERAAYLARAYADVTTDPARLMDTLDRLRPYHAAECIAEWQAMAGAGAFADLAAALMAHHYDPRYRKHRARMAVPVTDLAADSLSPDALPALAARIAALIPRLTATGDPT